MHVVARGAVMAAGASLVHGATERASTRGGGTGVDPVTQAMSECVSVMRRCARNEMRVSVTHGCAVSEMFVTRSMRCG